MPYLEKTLRRQLANTIDKARLVAEEGAADAIRRLAVADPDAPAWLSEPDCMVRRTLRAHARSLGDTLDGAPGCTRHLIETAAFEHWHRMLFGRFLVERGLLIHPTLGAPIAREELAELAADEGLPDAWALVERIAAPALPAVFKPHDPALQLPLAPEYAKRLRDLVAGLPEAVFEADDALGWTYQFWRAAEKERVNKAGGKIGAAELPVVTQLFTEPYMVRFLLHNTLGAWHAGRVLAADPALAQNAPDEAALRAACALLGYEWEFLRFVRSDEPAEAGGERTGPWRPAAGTYPGWPGKAAAITMLDPCCGSGHFLTEALVALAAMRGAEEGLSPAEAVAAVLRDNLHGLEIDGRCVQIAAFALALTAWRIGGPALSASGALPTPHVAWVGAPPPLPRAEFVALADGDTELRAGLAALHALFAQAPLLGSLIEVTGGDLLDDTLREHGKTALLFSRAGVPEMVEGVIAARGLLDAADLLCRKYVMIATNPPFLGEDRQDQSLKSFLDTRLLEGRAELATAMLIRSVALTAIGGTLAFVTPQNWLSLHDSRPMRDAVLQRLTISLIAGLGPRAFTTITGEAVKVIAFVAEHVSPMLHDVTSTIDVSRFRSAEEKAGALLSEQVYFVRQHNQMQHTNARILLKATVKKQHMSTFVTVFEGFSRGDTERFDRKVGELKNFDRRWKYLCTSGGDPRPFSGRTTAFLWEDGAGQLSRITDAKKGFRGLKAWGKEAIFVERTGQLKARLTAGDCFAQNCVALVPKDQSDLRWLYMFAQSTDYKMQLKVLGDKLILPTSVYAAAQVDPADWAEDAVARYPNGLPEPYSDDPTQWLFHGHPAYGEPGTQLHIALARLAGYRWPAETDTEMRLAPEAREQIAQAAILPAPDADGLLPLHAHGADPALADRLRTHLAAAFGAALSPEAEAALVRAADSKLDSKLDSKEARDATLEAWLRDRAFRQHSKLFHDRPFLWHVWDGLPRDGFSIFLHYHRLDHALLEKLTYTVLGDWISRTAAAGQVARNEAARGLKQRLEAILHGEAPHDIFVRWKPLARQPVGWTPDLDDGVRVNIRPFMKAGVLREPPRGIAWGKDRGTDVPSAPWFHLGPTYGEKVGARINDHYLTLAEKQAVRSGAPMAAD